jgi:hypothetical protein
MDMMSWMDGESMVRDQGADAMMSEMTDREFRTAARELVARVAQMTRYGRFAPDAPVALETEALLDRMEG